MRWILAALATAIGVGGWAFAVFFMLGADDIESELTAARAELSKTKAEQSTLSDEVAVFRDIHGRYQDVAANLEEMNEHLEDRRKVFMDLELKTDDARAELERLRTEAKKYGEFLPSAPQRYLSTTRAKIRAGSSTNSKQIAIVSEGVPISVYEMAEGGTWYKVGLTGYMYHELLKPGP